MPKIEIETSPEDLDLGFPLVDNGVYPSTLKFLGMEKAKESGNNMLVFSLAPQVPVQATIKNPDGTEVRREIPAGRELFKHRCVLTAKALRSLIELKAALPSVDAGVTVSEDKRRVSIESEERLAEFTGQSVRAQIDQRQGNDGNTYNQVKHILPA